MTQKENKKKLSIALSAEVVRTLDDYAMLLNVSRSRILDDILLQALPAMKPMIDAMVALKGGADVAEVKDMLEESQRQTKLLFDEMRK